MQVFDFSAIRLGCIIAWQNNPIVGNLFFD
jgi:hypothetical protein